ncbi:rhamnogalacturonan acetylesterase [Paenibacillus allorhizosphaerae]|uniref:Rhamnogalacturonan acetylesterase YesY n=1 Tax=Paenibacillus allorhizosphaerae TaxID=2849866 RepID=A0ABM8VDE3_9BACL|nr:rhamnogalacturonan acetylesterase [Paenibacillus allorhizosphaerae]CAG7627410.1 putative rhamnogalacturonan acetylesterase YesY [Paenibacillus allorhizosphaerae]
MADRNPTTLYIAGDSTVQTYGADRAPQAGWGQFIAEYFTDDLRFVNRAIGGRSSRTFIEEGRLEAILNEIKENDYLLVQMGHNDSTVSKPERYTEPYGAYKQYLKMYIEGARLRKSNPILFTPVGRLHYEDGAFINDFPDYCHAMKQVAGELEVPIVDLMARSLEQYTQLGYERATRLFMISSNGTDCTHITEEGAKCIANLVSQGIRELNLPISRYVK